MIPKSGQHVKCLLLNGIVLEGIVKEWAQDQVQLQSLNDQSISIITHPNEDIRVIKILAERVATSDPPPDTDKIPLDEIEKKFQQAYEEHHNPYDENRNKTLAELKSELIAQEKKIVSEKLKDHRPTLNEPRKVQYGTPGFLSQQKSK